MDLGGETGDLCSCWMGAHSDDPKSISRTHNFPSLKLVTPGKTCDLMIFSWPNIFICLPQGNACGPVAPVDSFCLGLA